jgi:hypothetical protein
MNPAMETAHAAMPPADAAARHREHRVERLIDRLPDALRTTTRWLRRPASRWVRIPVGLLLIGGGFLSILPFFGLWMAPLGLMLLAEDVPPLRRARDHFLDRIERHRPHWFGGGDAACTTRASPPHSPSVAGGTSPAGPDQ